jgi:hypothetical protein
MKTKVLLTALLFICLVFQSPVSFAKDKKPLTQSEQARINELVNRLEEIESIDIDNLSKTDKRALRKEVKDIKREVHAISGGIYISVGALILIVILLILLL